ncbi:ParM/StbA family protein [Cellulosilyticum sp. I15G10I2]|uniref:ParM/StbA family protein n=1 Tax=Cellulosilyticum sp. I15G10I2 TaxID=1892843 RepID=UPI00085C340F|nr:ParM/StbA family protein [Cellulosilyticum sp. I15G10I2]
MAHIAIDLGNFNVKTSNKTIFRATCTPKKDGTTGGIDKTIEYKGIKYYIEKGEFDTEFSKSRKEVLPLFLYALGKTVPENLKVINVVVGLPINQVSNRDELIEKLEGNFTFKIGGADRHIIVKEVKVAPECAGASLAIPEDVPQIEYILLDVGGLSGNMALFQDGLYVKGGSIPKGILNLVADITSAVNADYRLNLTTTQMYRKLVNDHLQNSQGKIDLEPYRITHFIPYVEEIFKTLTQQYEGLTTPIYVLGGGLDLLKPYVTQYLKQHSEYKMQVFNDNMFLNVKGFEKLGDQIEWKN